MAWSRKQHFHWKSQKHAGFYVIKLTRRLLVLWTTLGNNAILLLSRLTILVKLTAVILHNMSESNSTAGPDRFSFPFRVLN
jgi:hypothetical protein